MQLSTLKAGTKSFQYSRRRRRNWLTNTPTPHHVAVERQIFTSPSIINCVRIIAGQKRGHSFASETPHPPGPWNFNGDADGNGEGSLGTCHWYTAIGGLLPPMAAVHHSYRRRFLGVVKLRPYLFRKVTWLIKRLVENCGLVCLSGRHGVWWIMTDWVGQHLYTISRPFIIIQFQF